MRRKAMCIHGEITITFDIRRDGAELQPQIIVADVKLRVT